MRNRSIVAFLALALALALAATACRREQRRDLGEAAAPSTPPAVSATAPATDAPAPWSLGAGEVELALAVMTEVGRAPGNLCFSPSSLRMTGALLALVSRGDTAAELRRAFDLPDDPEALAAAYAALQASLADRAVVRIPPGVDRLREDLARRDVATVRLAAGLWTQTGTALEPVPAGTLGARVGTLDFAAQPDLARDEINRWAAEQTAGKLTALVPPRAVARDTSLAVASVLHFKAEWRDPWPTGSAKPGPFTTADGRRIEVPTLHGFGHEPYFENDGYQAVWRDYAGSGLGMVIVLPRRGRTVADIQASALRLAAGHFRSAEVDLSFPLFHIDAGLDAVPLLQRLGVRTLFEAGKAELRTVDPRGPVYLRTLVHDASIAIDERGTEVVAGTMGLGPPAAGRVDPEPMIVDRPFLFFIRDETTRALLAVGMVDDPSAI